MKLSEKLNQCFQLDFFLPFFSFLVFFFHLLFILPPGIKLTAGRGRISQYPVDNKKRKKKKRQRQLIQETILVVGKKKKSRRQHYRRKKAEVWSHTLFSATTTLWTSVFCFLAFFLLANDLWIDSVSAIDHMLLIAELRFVYFCQYHMLVVSSPLFFPPFFFFYLCFSIDKFSGKKKKLLSSSLVVFTIHF